MGADMSGHFEKFIDQVSELYEEEDTLEDFMHMRILLNGKPSLPSDFLKDFNTPFKCYVQEVEISIRELVVDVSKETVSARLEIYGHPRIGEGFRVVEQNIYKYRLGKVAEIWTMKDHSDLKRYKALPSTKGFDV